MIGWTPVPPPTLWHISIQRRAPYNGGDIYDRRSYRQFMVWPKTFKTLAEAQKYLDTCFTFKGIEGRKLSASVVPCNSTYACYDGPVNVQPN